MIDFVFTIDYEIYGNGTGTLGELVYEPAQRLLDLFRKHDARFVNFVEVAELEKIEAYGTDRAIGQVHKQIQEFHRDGFEIGLHLHPQWANARYEGGRWRLDLAEYNLCTLPQPRIAEIVDGALAYLKYIVGETGFTPLAFRAGNWLFQPAESAARVMGDRGIRIDSSVFKGGFQRDNRLDYRPAAKNGYFWPFSRDVNQRDPMGRWIEVPIHTNMVPIWKLPTSKRMGYANQFGVAGRSVQRKARRALDFLRFLYPLKLDFCRMTLAELTSMLEKVIRQDRHDPESYRPIVAIGHTKDLTDLNTVNSLLLFLKKHAISVSTFTEIYPKVSAGSGCAVPQVSIPQSTI